MCLWFKSIRIMINRSSLKRWNNTCKIDWWLLLWFHQYRLLLHHLENFLTHNWNHLFIQLRSRTWINRYTTRNISRIWISPKYSWILIWLCFSFQKMAPIRISYKFEALICTMSLSFTMITENVILRRFDIFLKILLRFLKP